MTFYKTFNTWVANRPELLATFADRVANKEYLRLPYLTWKKLAKSSYDQILIREIDTVFKIYEVIFIAEDSPDIQVDKCLYDGECDDFNIFLENYWEYFSQDENHILNYKVNNNNNEKENTDMKVDNIFNFEFGPVSSNQFRMSPYGLAINTADNGWVSYNVQTKEIFNVEIINFDISKLIYKMPVAFDAINIGDILIHSKKPVFVRYVNNDGTVSVVNYDNATVSNILPIKSPFGFNFFTKVCTIVDFDNNKADSKNPFGNILPFLLMSDNKDFDPMVFLLMNQNNKDFIKNPWLFYCLMKDEKTDILPFLFMNNNLFGTNNFTTAPELPATTN